MKLPPIGGDFVSDSILLQSHQKTSFVLETIQKLAELRSEERHKANEERRARPSWSVLKLSALPRRLYRPEQVGAGAIKSILNLFFIV